MSGVRRAHIYTHYTDIHLHTLHTHTTHSPTLSGTEKGSHDTRNHGLTQTPRKKQRKDCDATSSSQWDAILVTAIEGLEEGRGRGRYGGCGNLKVRNVNGNI